MRLGFFMMPVHPPARSFTETLAEDTEKSLLADRLGFTELWLGEHFSATSEPIPSPMMFMAGLVPRTKNISFGTGVICLPNHDPVVVAAEAAQFDHMSRGRFMLGVGPGGLVSDFELFRHTDVAVRNRKVVESVRIMQQIWSQDPPYDIDGEFWNVQLKDTIIPELGIGYMPKPFQKGGPPISLSLASPHSSSARTAALKTGASSRPTSSRLIRSRRIGPIYSKACAEAGKRVSRRQWRVARNVMVAPTEAEAQDRVFGEQAANRYLFEYVRTVLDRVGILVDHEAAAGNVRRRGDGRSDHRRLHAVRLAENHARQARRLPRGGRTVRHAADDRASTGRVLTKRGSGSRCSFLPERSCRSSVSTCWRRRQSEIGSPPTLPEVRRARVAECAPMAHPVDSV